MTGGRRNGGEVNVGGRGEWVEKGKQKQRKKMREGEHMWKSLQCGSRHSRFSRCILPGRAGSLKLRKISGLGRDGDMQIYKSTGGPDNALLRYNVHLLWHKALIGSKRAFKGCLGTLLFILTLYPNFHLF